MPNELKLKLILVLQEILNPENNKEITIKIKKNIIEYIKFLKEIPKNKIIEFV